MRKTNMSVAKRGMNRSTYSGQLDEQEYTFALNANMEDLGGETFVLTNEHSSILASKFKEGFVVVGLKNSVDLKKTFFFLTNPITGLSEFGQILDNTQPVDVSDTEVQCSDCDYQNVLTEPLESITQVEYQIYTTLLADCIDNKCLNFSVQHPVKKIEIKNEKIGTILVFTDNFNPPRYIRLNYLEEYSYTGQEVCGDDEFVVPTCLACNKMKVFRDFEVPQLIPESIILGGRLRMGRYQFLIAYSDESGNEMSEYYSITNSISIFDENNKLLEQENLADRTNFSIKLHVQGLDKNYTHYKVAVIQTADINNATSYFVEGVHPINDETVIYSGEENKQRIDVATLIKPNMFVKRWEGITQSNNRLFGYGIEVEKEMNLQPVVNFMGQFLKWQTHIATEDLYSEGVNTALFVGYNRDEVVPVGIRFYTANGYKTSIFPLIGRLPEPTDLAIVESNEDKDSILSASGSCIDSDRNKHWQLYNSATQDEDFCGNEEIPTIEVEEEVTKTCYIENIATSTNGTFTVELSEEFTNLEDYIEANAESCPEAFGASNLCDLLNPTNYPQTCEVGLFEDNCGSIELVDDPIIEVTPNSIKGNSTITLTGTSGVGNIKINGVNYSVTFDTDLSTTAANFVVQHQLALSNEGIDITSSGAVITLSHQADETPTIVFTPFSGDLNVVTAPFVGFVGIEKVFPDDYSFIKSPEYCSLYKIDYETGSVARDTDFEHRYRWLSPGTVLNPGTKFGKVFVRDYSFSNESCAYADDIINIDPSNSNLQGYFNNYLGADTEAELQTTISAGTSCLVPEFTDKIHKGALWFKGKTENRDSFILEVSKLSVYTGEDDSISGANPEIRISIFNKCNSTAPLHCEIFPIEERGIQYKISIVAGGFNLTYDVGGIPTTTFIAEANLFPNGNFFVAIDNPITICAGLSDMDDVNSAPVARYRTAPVDGCFAIATRDVEFSAATVSWSNITFRKKSVYRAVCTYNQPRIQKCTAVPFAKGKFAYTESTENYPDNQELFDSTILKIKPEDVGLVQADFESAFTAGLNPEGEYVWKLDDLGQPLVNYVCRPIRHFRLPDNKVAPFMYEQQQAPFNDALIYPLGFTIDENVINAFLDIASRNNLITEEQRNSITKYEIVRGDISNDRSIQASGLLYDMRSYKEKDKTVFYSNYPFNDLGADKMNLDTIEESIDSNSKFTFHSPETDYYKNTLPSEMTIQGYMYGKSKGNISEVDQHAKWVILTSKAKNLAGLLAGLEVASEIAVKIAQSAESWRLTFGFSNSANPVGIGLNLAVVALATAEGIVSSYGRYRYEWLKVFRDLGQPRNYASYYHAEGHYNYLKPLQEEGQYLRALNVTQKLKPNKSSVTDENTGERIVINNILREESVFISTGDFPIVYEDSYKNYDNNSVDFNSSSIAFASESDECSSGKSGDIIRNIASPYVALKNYIPSQHGTLNSIKWLSTGHIGDLKNPTSDCLSIFGGDTFISRHTLKRKLSLFLTDSLTLGSMTPFNYSFYSNIGTDPRFFVDYELTRDFAKQSALFPDIDSDYRLDCLSKSGNYVASPSKFYLYYYGVPNFLCESRINTNFRYGKTDLANNFFPEVGDLDEWTQEKNVPIRTRNSFFYNDVYSRGGLILGARTLPDSYSKAIYDKAYDRPNGLMFSLPDNDENNLNEPWLIYRPFDFHEFPTKYGKLKDLKGIESNAVLGRFENQTAIFNTVDVTVETGAKIENNNMGSGFSRRPVTFTETDLGYMGSQTSEMVSCEYGHFFVDAKRGHVFKVESGGAGKEEISSVVGGKPSGMAHWFKEHLPFKILKSGIQGIDTDNAMNGIGIAMGWDSRFKRVFITKRDYTVNSQYVNILTYEDGVFYHGEQALSLSNTQYFTDVSWTIAFSPVLNAWLSYYDFKPNYYINHNYHFQTGVNIPTADVDFGLWSHLLTNKSYQVFYGKKYDFNVEYPDKQLYGTRTLNNVNMWTEVRRYNGSYDYAYTPYLTFNEAIIHNNVANSGKLNLIPQKNNLGQNKNFPKTNPNNTQDILVSNRDNFEWSFDYIYDRVKDNSNNEPKWLWDKNQIIKTLNNKAIAFTGKRVLSYLKGDYFLVNLTYNKDSRYKILHKWSTQDYSI